MNAKKFTEELCLIYNKSHTTIVKTKHGKTPAISFGALCELIYYLKTITNICEELSISIKTLRKALAKSFPDIAGNKGIVWRVELLSKLGYRRCHRCTIDKPILEGFYNSINSRDGKSWHCKDCAKELNKAQRETNPEIIKASNRKRKAVINGSLDAGANLDLIKLIYKNCPIGYHVDHIIPVSKDGKHHENNLCYLPALLNMRKGSKLAEDVPEIMAQAIYPNLEQLN